MEKGNLSKVKILDKIRQYEKTGDMVCTDFLDPAEIIENKGVYSKVPHVLFGGFEDCERKIILFGTDNIDDAKDVIRIIKISSPKSLSHREVLGSVLGLGIKRNVIGDIIVNDCIANVFVSSSIVKFIIQNLDKIGKERVKLEEISYEEIIEKKEEYTEIKTTVASLRIDSAISACFGLSRGQSVELVENGRVKINYIECNSSSKQIHENDLISVRGFGRFIIEEILGETRKGRISIKLKIYKK